jgi:hypothetical protein
VALQNVGSLLKKGDFIVIAQSVAIGGKGSKGKTIQKRIYSIKEMVSEIGATEWYWRSQIWEGNLPYVQVGQKIFIDREDIESFIQRNKFAN